MKKSDLKLIIKECIKEILTENLFDENLTKQPTPKKTGLSINPSEINLSPKIFGNGDNFRFRFFLRTYTDGQQRKENSFSAVLAEPLSSRSVLERVKTIAFGAKRSQLPEFKTSSSVIIKLETNLGEVLHEFDITKDVK